VPETLRQPLDQMRVCVGTDLDRVAHLHRESTMRGDRVIEYRARKLCRGRWGETRQHVASGQPSRPADNQQADRCRGAGELAVMPAAALCHQVSDLQPPRNRLTGLCGKGCAQSLALLSILRPLLPQLGMGREVGVDSLGTLGR